MKISLLCTDPNHPVMPWLERWACDHAKSHEVMIHSDISAVESGDILFLVSCSQILTQDDRSRFSHVLVLHASDLPSGRGWSPHVWAILAGADTVTVSLLEAADPVDSGLIWAKQCFDVPDHALYDEINSALFMTELALMDKAIALAGNLKAECLPDTSGIEPSYHRRRRPEDSAIDPHRSIVDQFDIIRLTDPKRYPAFFDLKGHRFFITLRKLAEDEED